jgi:hypothetical protein
LSFVLRRLIVLSETPTDLMPASVLMLVSPTTPNPVTTFAPIDPTDTSPVLAPTHVQIKYKRALSGKRVTFTATVLTESGEKPTGTVIFQVQWLPIKEVKLQDGTASAKMKPCLMTDTITVTYSGDTRHASSSEDQAMTSATMMSDAAPVRSEPTAPAVAAEAVEQGTNSNGASPDDPEGVMLADEIQKLWTCDKQAGYDLVLRRRRLKDSRIRFGECLAAYQQRLAKPGRDGMFAAFLKRLHIPKSTALRYIKHWKLSVCPESVTPDTAVVGEPSDQDVTDLVKKMKSTAKRVLTTEDSVTKFLIAFTAALQTAKGV